MESNDTVLLNIREAVLTCKPIPEMYSPKHVTVHWTKFSDPI